MKKGKLVVLFTLIALIATILVLNKPASAEPAPAISPTARSWWDPSDPSFQDRPSQPQRSESNSAQMMTASTTTSSDPRYKCSTPPPLTLQANQFLVFLSYYGSIDIDPGTTGKSVEDLRMSIGRRYTYTSETIGDSYPSSYTSKYTITGRPSPVSTAVVGVKACYMDFKFVEWGSELARSEWKKISASFDTTSTSTPDGYRVFGTIQVLMKVNA